MTHELSVKVHADMDQHELRLIIAGCLTADGQPSLLPVVRRACALEPLICVTIDLTRADHIDPAALALLRAAVDQVEREEDLEPVVFLVPEQLPTCSADFESGMVSGR